MTDDLPIVKSMKMVRESDLTYRLRTSADPDMVHEAADRIEKLEAALRKYADEEYNGYNANGGYARKALEGES